MITRDVKGRERTVRVAGAIAGGPIYQVVLDTQDVLDLDAATDIELRHWVNRLSTCFPPMTQASSFYSRARDNISTDDI